MNLPDQVRTAGDKARQLQEELGKPATAEPGTPPATEPKPVPAAAEPAAPATPPTPQTADWEQKYKSLQGMFNTQVPKLQSELKAANQQIANLQATIEAAAKQPAAPTTTYLTDKDLEDFDKDTIDVMRRAARQEAEERYGPIIAQLQQQLATLQSTVIPKVTKIEAETNTSRVDRFVSALDQAAPEWRSLNNDEGFLSWLDELDPFAGSTRQALLNAAVDAGDAARASTFFKAYSQSRVVPPTPSVPAASQQLEALVSPGKGRGGAPPTEKPPITREQIAQFYRDVSNGKYKGRSEEKARIEADIFAAQREGRVT